MVLASAHDVLVRKDIYEPIKFLDDFGEKQGKTELSLSQRIEEESNICFVGGHLAVYFTDDGFHGGES